MESAQTQQAVSKNDLIALRKSLSMGAERQKVMTTTSKPRLVGALAYRYIYEAPEVFSIEGQRLPAETLLMILGRTHAHVFTPSPELKSYTLKPGQMEPELDEVIKAFIPFKAALEEQTLRNQQKLSPNKPRKAPEAELDSEAIPF